jgi:Uri superfamily endonuclease
MDLNFPTAPGVYALELTIDHAVQTRIGALGEALFPPGYYIYLGSACGPGGLKSRLGRHVIHAGKKFHWHIDYLRDVSRVSACSYVVLTAAHSIECLWSQALAAMPEASIPIKRFGASDCRSGCPTHLIQFPFASCSTPPLLHQIEIRKTLEWAAQAPIITLTW